MAKPRRVILASGLMAFSIPVMLKIGVMEDSLIGVALISNVDFPNSFLMNGMDAPPPQKTQSLIVVEFSHVDDCGFLFVTTIGDAPATLVVRHECVEGSKERNSIFTANDVEPNRFFITKPIAN